MAAMRGTSPRNGDKMISVSSVDDNGPHDNYGELQGQLLSSNLGRSGKKKRGLSKMIRNFFMIKLRYDPTVAIIFLMVIATTLIVFGVLVGPMLYDRVEHPEEYSDMAPGNSLQAIDGLQELEPPDELTSENLADAKNGDMRFSLNDKNYAMSAHGDIYVAEEDLVKPYILPDGTYNPANVRHLRYKPGRITLLPEFITQEEADELLKAGDRQFRSFPQWTGHEGGGDIAVFPNATELQTRILKRVQPWIGLKPENVQPWHYRVIDINEKDIPEELKRNFYQHRTAPLIHHDWHDLHNTTTKDWGRVASGTIFLESRRHDTKQPLLGGGSIFLTDIDIRLTDDLLLSGLYYIPRLKELLKYYEKVEKSIEKKDPMHLNRNTGDEARELEEDEKFDKANAKMMWGTIDSLCSMTRDELHGKVGEDYLYHLFELEGALKIKPQERTVVLYDNVFTKHIFRDKHKAFPIRTGFHGVCDTLGIRKSYTFFYQDNHKDAQEYRDLLYNGKITVKR